MKVLNVDNVTANDVIQRNQHRKEKNNLSSIVITDLKLASCWRQEHLHSKISGAWLCVYVSITVLFWQNVHVAISANIYLFKVLIVTLE